ncbi:hypothetical protein JET68_09220 [Pseudomonas monteilii]|uniref:hypothetical protein n=1 Tax=Pseudomonas TaxID=286 RepID=UPI0018E6B982|nr:MULTISPECIES: hypothetical protein [Pseudomonas]MBI6918977.1 hypothetical protein [Pseudomonas monteilii]MCA4074657.1 hypothetical protein [Pseudomonas kurunegalensis]MCE0937103.1 hypothetical protein [Pseudomonas kurunegalensis]MDT3745674.1 hypothetical protein [Pseudomonas kurunegalensis]
MTRFTIKHYFNGPIEDAEFKIAIQHTDFITDEGIDIPELPGYEFACYLNYANSSIIDHNYYKSLTLKFNHNLQVVSFEIFARSQNNGNLWRIIGYAKNSELKLSTGTVIPYRFTPGTSKDLVIYFDYSRLVSKVLLHEEHCPRFGFKTDKSVLVISNNFGHWGTGCLFDSNGKSILPNILKLITDLSIEHDIERTFMVGGSQGGVAALVYGGLINNCKAIHSCVPVHINKGSMLKHISHLLTDEDVWFASRLLENSLQSRSVHLYSTVGDPISEYHQQLSILGGSSTQLHICQDKNIGHMDCLKYFIKDVYQSIESS